MASQLPQGPLPLSQSPYLTLLREICGENLYWAPSRHWPTSGAGHGPEIVWSCSQIETKPASPLAPLSSYFSALRSQGDNIIWCSSCIFDPTVGRADKVVFSFSEVLRAASTPWTPTKSSSKVRRKEWSSEAWLSGAAGQGAKGRGHGIRSHKLVPHSVRGSCDKQQSSHMPSNFL